MPNSTPPSATFPAVTQAQLDALGESVAKHHGADAGALIQAACALIVSVDGKPPARLDAPNILADMRVDPDAVAAALLAPYHATLGHDLINTRLGPGTAALVSRVNRVSSISWDRPDEAGAEALRKMFLAMAKDVRVVLVVLALRVQLMRSLLDEPISNLEATRVARETLDVFAPLANRLGIWQTKWELEDASFRILEPATFEELQRLLDEKREQRQTFIDEVTSLLNERLQAEGIEASVKGRPKHVYSIYKKMQRKQINFDQVYDVSAVRAITTRVQDCYAILGIVHSLWVPIPSEFDDYIAMPKPNGYQSLHTAVMGPRGRPVEVQIRTQEMHRFGEFGVAAHWAYKEHRQSKNLAQDKFMLLRQLIDWEREVTDSEQFVESLKTDVFDDQVFVFTPEGDIIDLPKGATPLDFAYRIHTLVGHRCRGARVNDQIVPIDHALNTGDRVEILTHKQPHPSRDWMNPALGYLRTASARSKVKHWFKEQGRESAIAAGRELIGRELARMNISHTSLEEIATELHCTSVDDLYAQVGFGDRRAQAVAGTALNLERAHSKAAKTDLIIDRARKKKRAPSGLSMDGVNDIQGNRAQCCNPLPGDAVVGFVSRGRGMVIHRRDCPQIQESREPERLVDIDWGPEGGELHTVAIEVHAADRPGLLGDLLKLIAHLGAYITGAQVHPDRKGAAVIQLSLEFRSTRHVAQVLERLDRHPEVTFVRRVS